MTAGEVVLKTEFVDSDYFLLRVKHFEERYNQSWGQFLGDYTSGNIDKKRNNPDFVEWAFLCRNFLSELIAEGSPPGSQANNIFFEKPEADSGSCFWGQARQC